jgi:hypothetical protein
MEEVHVLALHYHWSEAEILRLPGPKRQRYIALLARHLAQPATGAIEPHERYP